MQYFIYLFIQLIPFVQAVESSPSPGQFLSRAVKSPEAVSSEYSVLSVGSFRFDASLKTQKIPFKVEKGTISLLFSAVSPHQAEYHVHKLIDPDGKVIDLKGLTRAYEFNSATLLYPNDGSIQFLKAGQWNVIFRAEERVPQDEVQVAIVLKKAPKLAPKRGRIHLKLYFSGSHGITAENYAGLEFGKEIQKMKTAMAQYGIIVDVSVGGNIDKKFQSVATYKDPTGSIAHIEDLLKSVRPTEGTVHVFVVERLETEASRAQGISLGAPSVWTSNSLTLESTPFDPIERMFRVRELIMHELGHLLGLYHVIEPDETPNHLTDIKADDNIMMFGRNAPVKMFRFSPSQINIMMAHPLVKWEW